MVLGHPDGLTLAKVREAPHSIDLGPLRPRLPEMINTASGRIELAPAPIVADLARLKNGMRDRPGGMLLIGRRNLRTSNSFTCTTFRRW